MKKRKIFALVVVVALMITILSGCGYVQDGCIGFQAKRGVIVSDKPIQSGEHYTGQVKEIRVGISEKRTEFYAEGQSSDKTAITITGYGSVTYRITSEDAALWLLKNYEGDPISDSDFLTAIKDGINKINAAQVAVRSYTHPQIIKSLQDALDNKFSAYPNGSVIEVLSVNTPDFGFNEEYDNNLNKEAKIKSDIDNVENETELLKKQAEYNKVSAEAEMEVERIKSSQESERIAEMLTKLIESGISPEDAVEIVKLEMFCDTWNGELDQDIANILKAIA